MTIHTIAPKGSFETFIDENHYKEKLKEWGISSAREAKKEFLYKEGQNQYTVSIKGYESYGITGEFDTVVIEFQDGKQCCIHPAYLKEMQQSSFGKENIFSDVGSKGTESAVVEVEADSPTLSKNKSKPKKTTPKKEKAVKIDLPSEKVHFTAKVKQFALTYNPFNEENDEVVILEDVQISQDPPLVLDYAWCSHSKTLKKFELVTGDLLEFDGKVTAKKLAKGKDVPEDQMIEVPVLYKINNPSKIIKNK